MRISPISNSYYQRFKASSDEIEVQTRQAMKNCMKSIEEEAIDSVSSEITTRYMKTFQDMIKKQNKTTTTNDTKVILQCIKDAYTQAKLTDDANALGQYIQTLS